MGRTLNHSGFAIALAWPQTYCKEPGSWYDPVTRWMGINRNNYYKAGHAALVLVDRENEICHYFDFGRYHAPFQYGRVRSAETDHDLVLTTRPEISPDGESILNFYAILGELQNNPACHGEGALHASYSRINFGAAIKKARRMQAESPIPYGPFIAGGSNCSRFVNSVIIAGRPGWRESVQLQYFIPLTPTPLNNVRSLLHKEVMPPLRNSAIFQPVRPLSRGERYSTLPQPGRHPGIPENAQWLSGEGAGSWFYFIPEQDFLRVNRYAPDGTLECRGIYQCPGIPLPLSWKSARLDYPSNCREVILTLDGRRERFVRISEGVPVPETVDLESFQGI